MARILYIEPDRILSRTFATALTQAGHQAIHFSDAAQAMQTADRLTPDVLVLELQLARHNGVDFLYEFRSYREWHGIPIIILSVIPPHEASISAELWQMLGLHAYLYKPHTSLQQLIVAVSLATAVTLVA